MSNTPGAASQSLFEDLFERALSCANAGQLIEALKLFGEAYKISPQSHEVLWNAGIINEELGRNEMAVALYEKTLQLNPDAEYLFGNELLLRMRMCDWKDFEGKLQNIAELIAAGKKASPPFATSLLLDSPELQMLSAKQYGLDNFPSAPPLPSIARKNNKIRIGYYSANFNNHAVAHLMAGVFAAHDDSQFETFAFSFGPAVQDPIYARLKTSFDYFFEVNDKTDNEVAQLSRELSIDIAIDMMGYTRDMRAGIFAFRAAPIQVNFLGYPGTMGLSHYDYIISDKTLIPKQSQNFYSEKIVYLPNSYLPSSYSPDDSEQGPSNKKFTRNDFGLPEEGFVFACFNNPYKINPAALDMWVKILNATPGSVLWLYEGNQIASKNLKAEVLKRGLSPDRLIFAGLLPEIKDHFARIKLADLFLDTAPYGAHTTACDALWAGLPVVTLMGNSFASRVGASLLNAVGLPELITSTQAEYEGLAIHLASNPQILAEIRGRLESGRITCKLFDTLRYTNDIERAYIKMIEQYRLGNPPEHIYIS